MTSSREALPSMRIQRDLNPACRSGGDFHRYTQCKPPNLGWIFAVESRFQRLRSELACRNSASVCDSQYKLTAPLGVSL